MPKRKAEDDTAPKGKKTTVSKKTVVTTVTIEDEPTSKPKSKSNSSASSSKTSQAQLKGRKSPGPMALPGFGHHLAFPGGSSGIGGISPAIPPTMTQNYGFHRPLNTPDMSSQFMTGVGRNSPTSILSANGYQISTPGGLSSTPGQMPMQLQSFSDSSKASSSSAVGRPKKSESGGAKFIWLIYHKTGRQDPQLMGAYTAAKTALKNAKAVIDRETGGAERRTKEVADFSDFSSNIQAEQGSVYEVKYPNGGKNIVSFKKVKLNENLSDEDVEDDGEEAFQIPFGGRVPGLKAADRAAIGWL